MPHYLFRRDFIQPKGAKERTLIDNIAQAMKEVQQMAPHLGYDLSQAEHDIDAAGERVEMQVGTQDDIGWHITHADVFAVHGVLVTRFQSR